MRMLFRNKRRVYYATPVGEEVVKDQYGHITSERKRIYSEPKTAFVNYSSERGESVVDQFGEMKEYDLVIVSTKKGFPVVESDAVWVNAEASKPHDYRVVRVADSLNIRQVLVRRVVDS